MIKYDPVAGLTIEEAVKEAISIAKKTNSLVQANLNDILLFVTPASQQDKMVTLYRYKLHLSYKNSDQKIR